MDLFFPLFPGSFLLFLVLIQITSTKIRRKAWLFLPSFLQLLVGTQDVCRTLLFQTFPGQPFQFIPPFSHAPFIFVDIFHICLCFCVDSGEKNIVFSILFRVLAIIVSFLDVVKFCSCVIFLRLLSQATFRSKDSYKYRSFMCVSNSHSSKLLVVCAQIF